jgi:hypothetical protein
MSESSRHRVAFHAYFYLGPNRTLEELHGLLRREPRQFGFARPPSWRTIERWSARYDWQDRIADLEAEARKRDSEEQLDELRQMNDRHAKEGRALQQKAIQRLHALSENELAPETAVRALVEGIKLERLAAGEATDRTAIEGGIHVAQVNLSSFSEDELRQLAGLTGGRPREARRRRPT